MRRYRAPTQSSTALNPVTVDRPLGGHERVSASGSFPLRQRLWVSDTLSFVEPQPELPPFDKLFLQAEPAVLNQQHKRETPPVNGGRWPVSVVLFPEATMAMALGQVMEEALQLAGPGHFHTGLAGSSHFTVRALEYYRDDVGPDDAEVVRYRRAMQFAASRCGPVALNVTGLTLTLGSVMAAAKPADEEADRFMDALKEELGQDAWLEADFRRDIWYLNVLHFANDIAYPDRLVEWVKERRDLDLGVAHADRAHLVRFRYDDVDGRPFMRPEIFGEAVLAAAGDTAATSARAFSGPHGLLSGDLDRRRSSAQPG